MDIKLYTKPDRLERYSFLWSEARLVVAALALFIGGTPPVIRYNPFPSLFGLILFLVTIAWIVSGVASAYLVHRWVQSDKKLFGKKLNLDTGAFLVSVVSGINLGLAGVGGKNIGMAFFSGKILFMLVALLYVASAAYLFWRWRESGEKIF